MIRIINQIQASITGEAIYRLDRYDEVQCDKNKIEYIQGKHKLPLKPSHRDGKYQVPPGARANKQNKLHQGFDENVSQLLLCINVLHHYVSLLNMISQEVVSHFYVFCSLVENWILG
jgi:hypothetical protein